MSHPYHHAISSTRRWGGTTDDYLAIHEWFDASKEMHADVRHRALRHHTQGIYEAERHFGTTITNVNGRKVPVRLIAEQHVLEDLGRIPSLSDWLSCMRPERWMCRAQRLSKATDQSRLEVVNGTR